MKKIILSLFIAIVLTGCSNNGDKVSKDYLEVYYKDGITKEQAEKTLDYFLPKWRDEGDKTARKSIQLTKTGDSINFRMVANMDIMGKMDEDIFYTTGNELSADLFNGAPVNIVLAGKKFETIRTYVFKTIKTIGTGEKVTAGNVEVFPLNNISDEEAGGLARFLDKLDGEGGTNTKSVQISRETNGDYKLAVVYDAAYAKNVSDEEFMDLATTISDNVLEGAPVILELTNNQFVPFRTFFYKTKESATGSSSGN